MESTLGTKPERQRRSVRREVWVQRRVQRGDKLRLLRLVIFFLHLPEKRLKNLFKGALPPPVGRECGAIVYQVSFSLLNNEIY